MTLLQEIAEARVLDFDLVNEENTCTYECDDFLLETENYDIIFSLYIKEKYRVERQTWDSPEESTLISKEVIIDNIEITLNDRSETKIAFNRESVIKILTKKF